MQRQLFMEIMLGLDNMELGKPIEMNPVVYTAGQPKMFLEVLDDTGSVPKCVLGRSDD